ncbi:hypothetical protein N7474_010080 [Penicillium riverlandense]|uniref:uncharacterized protein n=1 Tax=Penicillium riverlandense TaxID=1903569 RepID=UPI002549A765|nr:uncharacterized protein N7474_010080 [Penicillium riverlandense]KAJ5808811.1 hypothetical protein N7474_010080 [Penicillium riverlandense]
MRTLRYVRLGRASAPFHLRQNALRLPSLCQCQQTRPIASQTPRLRRPFQTTNQTNLRAFHLPSLSSFLPSSSSNGNGNGDNNNGRILTAARTLPYPPELLFSVISAVESYSQFLPFLTASTVTARDPVTNLPTQAFLTVGYGPLSETFTSCVDCDAQMWVVEARSGAKYSDQKSASFFPGATEGVFKYLSTRWELEPSPQEGRGTPQTKVRLEVRFEFQNQLHATVMSTVEGQMATVMIEAFEKRIREVEGRGR